MNRFFSKSSSDSYNRKDNGLAYWQLAIIISWRINNNRSGMVGNLGYETYLAADSTATINNKGIERTNYPAELIHETVLASLHPEFATIIITDFIKRSILSVLTIK